MKTHSTMDHIRLNPEKYCPGYENNTALLEMALRFLSDSAIAKGSTRIDVALAGECVQIRAFGKAIPFEVMRRFSCAFQTGMGFSNHFYGEEIPMILMALCKDAELTSFCAGRRLTASTAQETRCGEESTTSEPDGVEMRLTHEKEFDPAEVDRVIGSFHTRFPMVEIRVNGKILQ